MRDWRKVYGSLVESDRLDQVTDGAALLFVFLLVKQDDAGHYPNTPARLRALALTRDWTDAVRTAYVLELLDVGLVSLSPDKHMFVIRRGQELNGPPKDGTENHRKPRHYPVYEQRTDSVRTESVPSTYNVLQEIRLEEKREEINPLPPSAQVIRPSRTRHKALWICPDWFKPLQELPGYKPSDYGAAVGVIEAASGQAGVTPAAVVTAFFAYYARGRMLYGWKDPVRALVRTIDVQVSKVKNGGMNGTTGRGAADFSALAERAKAGR